MSDIELLKLEIETLWVTDARGRLVAPRANHENAAPHMVIGAATDGTTTTFSSELPELLVIKLREEVEASEPSRDPSLQPPALARCADVLARALGPVDITSGPSYIVPPGVEFKSSAEIVTSDDPRAQSLPVLAKANWAADEWQALVEGRLGPWAAAIANGQIVSLCHSARLAECGAEAGVWTDPSHRDQGHAAAVTAAWAALLAPTGRTLFYSTSADNRSSRRVAARLNLREIGRLWQIARRP